MSDKVTYLLGKLVAPITEARQSGADQLCFRSFSLRNAEVLHSINNKADRESEGANRLLLALSVTLLLRGRA